MSVSFELRLSEERLRLNELWAYDVVDTTPDPRFDEIVSLAASICRAPMAAITFVEADRLWLKSRIGLTQDEMQRDGSFCDSVVSRRAPLAVQDAQATASFRDLDIVRCAGGVRAYLGCPIESPAGAVLGTLCVLDREPRDWTDLEQESLRVLTAQVLARLNLRRAYSQLMQLWDERRVLEARATAGRQEDRRRLAAELHDGLGQDLTGISLLLKTVRGHTDDPRARDELRRIEQLTRSAIETCRRLARGQGAFGFIHASLRESLEHYIAAVNETSGIHCDLEWPQPLALSDRTVAYNLYRIAQEAVTNALRHSGGPRVVVRVRGQDDRVVLEVEDDGQGLVARAGTDHGVGLETMRYRASTIGARLEMLPRAPHGLLVRCELLAERARNPPSSPRGATNRFMDDGEPR